MTTITADQVLRLARKAHPVYRKALETAAAALQPYGILETPRRLAHFMAQILHESGGFTVLEENLNYRAERLLVVFPKYFKTRADADLCARNPEALAEKVYGGRMGNVRPGDGFRYRGRGPLQITGKNNYATVGKKLGDDLVTFPDLVISERYALRIPALFWRDAGCNLLADADDLTAVTKAINGGTIGLEDRRAWLAKTKAMWP